MTSVAAADLGEVCTGGVEEFSEDVSWGAGGSVVLASVLAAPCPLWGVVSGVVTGSVCPREGSPAGSSASAGVMARECGGGGQDASGSQVHVLSRPFSLSWVVFLGPRRKVRVFEER
ncbi:MAG: hypothetical protein L0J79_06475, partial [Propionibacterium sp.]|nr:hypothetical protein [Propionibacterium sp.]